MEGGVECGVGGWWGERVCVCVEVWGGEGGGGRGGGEGGEGGESRRCVRERREGRWPPMDLLHLVLRRWGGAGEEGGCEGEV